jgi:hypothetical protein
MISNEKVNNNKVLQLIEIYNFGLGHFFIRICLIKLKLLNLDSKRKKKGKRKNVPAYLPPPAPPLILFNWAEA